MKSLTVTSSGDLGDICVLLSVLNEIGCKHTLLLGDFGMTKGIVKRIPVIKPLVDAMPYIKECREWKDGDKADWRSENFRSGYHSREQNLVTSHANHGIANKVIPSGVYGKEQWIEVEPTPIAKVIVARSMRYNNQFFPWKKIVDHYSVDIAFVGTQEEYGVFCNLYGKVDYYPTPDLLCVAQAIAGSQLFIGNQSSPMAIAEGLKHNSIQETCLHIPDCVYRRPNAQHVGDGGVTLPDISGSGELIIAPTKITHFTRKSHISPPGGWQCGPHRAGGFEQMLSLVMKDVRKSKEEATEEIYQAQFERIPEFYRNKSSDAIFATFKKMMA